MPFRSRFAALCVACLLATSASWAQRGALTVPVNLAQITDRAGVIVHAAVERARVEPHPEFSNLMTVVVTVRVRDHWKGNPPASYTFRQFIWDLRDRHSAAGYRKGDELLLFMNPVNQQGLTSPVGLEQGRFRVIRDASGSARVVNGRDNVGLLRQTSPRLQTGAASLNARTAAASHQKGPLALQTMREFVIAFENSRKARVRK